MPSPVMAIKGVKTTRSHLINRCSHQRSALIFIIVVFSVVAISEATLQRSLFSSHRLNSKAPGFNGLGKKAYTPRTVNKYQSNQEHLGSDQIDSILLKSYNFSSTGDFLEAFGIQANFDQQDPLDGVAGRRKGKATKMKTSLQANCEPELRTIKLDDVPTPGHNASTDSNELLFPHCVRVPRCGGCCGLSDRLQCVPSKVSYKDIRRARVRVRRDLRTGRGRPEASALVTRVEVHDECRCACKITENDCDSKRGHTYRADLCSCECWDKKSESTCSISSSDKFWDKSDCTCKCRKERLCSTGFVFSHHSCGCEVIVMA